MGRQIAIAVLPFHGRLRASAAIPTRIQLGRTSAALAGLDDLMAQTTVVTATFGGHKCAFSALANGLTNHGNHPPFLGI